MALFRGPAHSQANEGAVTLTAAVLLSPTQGKATFKDTLLQNDLYCLVFGDFFCFVWFFLQTHRGKPKLMLREMTSQPHARMDCSLSEWCFNLLNWMHCDILFSLCSFFFFFALLCFSTLPHQPRIQHRMCVFWYSGASRNSRIKNMRAFLEDATE